MRIIFFKSNIISDYKLYIIEKKMQLNTLKALIENYLLYNKKLHYL